MDLFEVESESWPSWTDSEIDEPTLPKLKEIASLVECALCGGYLIDATTINRCLHSFCRACIVAHLEVRNVCPTCNRSLNPVCPHSNLRRDRVLQRIVYKIIPGLYHYELKRRVEFAEKLRKSGQRMSRKKRSELGSRSVIYSDKDLFSIALFYGLDETLARASRATEMIVKYSERSNEWLNTYLECPSKLTVRILKKFVRTKFEVNDCFSVELFSTSGERLGDRMTLMDIAYSSASGKIGMLQLYFLVVNRRFFGKSLTVTNKSPPSKRRRSNLPERTFSLRSRDSDQVFCPVSRTVSQDDSSRPIRNGAKCDNDKNSSSSVSQSATVIHHNLDLSISRQDGNLMVDNKYLCEISPNEEQVNYEITHSSNRPIFLVNSLANTMTNPEGVVFQCSGSPSFQLVSLCAPPCIPGGVCEPAMRTASESDQLLYPGICIVPQDDQHLPTLTASPGLMGTVEFTDQFAAFGVMPWRQDLSSHWRIYREMLEAQHYQTIPDFPVMSQGLTDGDGYVSVTSVEISSEPDKLLCFKQFSAKNFTADAQPEGSLLGVNDLMTTAAAFTSYASESVEISKAVVGFQGDDVLNNLLSAQHS